MWQMGVLGADGHRVRASRARVSGRTLTSGEDRQITYHQDRPVYYYAKTFHAASKRASDWPRPRRWWRRLANPVAHA